MFWKSLCWFVVSGHSLCSGGVGMAIVGFSRSAKMGDSAIVGLGK